MASKSSDWQPGPSVCRCCLGEGCYKDISTEYFWMGKREVYAEMLTQTLDLEIAFSQNKGPNSNSRLICESCISRLRDATEFKRQVQECEKTFMQHLDIEKDPDPIYADTEEQKDVKLECVKEEQLLSDDDDDRYVPPDFPDDDDDDLDDEPLTKLVRKVPKKESIDMIEEFLDEDDDEKPVVVLKRKSTTKNKASSAKKSKVAKKTSDTATASKAKPEKKKKGLVNETLPNGAMLGVVKPIKERKKIVGPRQMCRRLHALNKMTPAMEKRMEKMLMGGPIKKEKRVRVTKKNEIKNTANILAYTTAIPFVFFGQTFKCLYCNKYITTIPKIIQHTKDHGVIDVTALIDKYLKISKICFQADISDLNCRLCNEEYADLDKIKEHLCVKHDIKFDPGPLGITGYDMTLRNGMLKCHICNEKFPKFTQLNTHVNTHVGSVFCETCGAGFIAKNHLKKHLNKHKSQFKCNDCGVIFAKQNQLTYHQNYVHKQKVRQLFKCSLCEMVFREHYTKMGHMRNVHGLDTTLECHICGGSFKTRQSLTQHINIHDEKYKCEVCDRCFAQDCKLKKHMAQHHVKVIHKCQHCDKKFLLETDLQQHLETHASVQYICDDCGKGFYGEDACVKHIKLCHI